mgnify:CR=1 FL=1
MMSIFLAQSKTDKWHVWNSSDNSTLCGRNLPYPLMKKRNRAGKSVKGFTQPIPISDGSFCKHCLARINTLLTNIAEFERVNATNANTAGNEGLDL